MRRRTAKRLATGALLAVAACGHDATGPSAPTCSSALASQLTLAVGAYASIDPASDGGCVTFPANPSVDSAEYLLVPQSAAATFDQTAPFRLRTATLQATATPLAQRLAEPPSPRAAPTLFDGNGVVIALMTPVVNALVTKAACNTSGYIAGFFLPDDLDQSAPLSRSNHGEIFYSIVADPAGTLSCAHTSAGVKTGTPGTFVHELQHMINFAQHVLINGGPRRQEGGLDEGRSHDAVDRAGPRDFAPAAPAPRLW